MSTEDVIASNHGTGAETRIKVYLTFGGYGMTIEMPPEDWGYLIENLRDREGTKGQETTPDSCKKE